MLSPRDQPTPPFNSPYQMVTKPNSMLHSPAYPSPARSDSEPCRYPDGLGLSFDYPHGFSAPTQTNATLLPPSPQPSWHHLSTGTSPLVAETPADPWSSPYDPPVSRSPLPWNMGCPQHLSQRPSVSYARDVSIFSRDSPDSYTNVKLEGGAEWPTDDDSSSMGPHRSPLTIAPQHLTTSAFPYEQPSASPPMKFEPTMSELYGEPSYHAAVSARGRQRSPRSLDESHKTIVPRTRRRRAKSSAENEKTYVCEICGECMVRKYNLKQHMETHNPSRKMEYVCTEAGCKRSFVRRADLERHIKSIHLRLREFECSACHKDFARKDTLRRHQEDGGCTRKNEVPILKLPARFNVAAPPAGYYSAHY